MSLVISIENQPVELLSLDSLGLINDKTKKVDNFILSTFFGNQVGFANKDYVPLDSLDTSVPLAPFVSPMAQSKPIVTKGEFKRENIQAPYLKPSLTLTPQNVYDIALIGELRKIGVIGNSLSISRADQLKIAQVTGFMKLREAIDNRKILMATDILTKGKTVCVGDDYPAYEIDFKRDKALTFAPTVKWNEPNATPVTDIEKMLATLVDKGGMSAKVIVSSSAVFTHAYKNDEFKERFVKPNGANAPSPFTPMFNRTDTAQFRGEIDGVAWWTYDVMHTLNGTAQRFIDRTGFYLIADTNGFTAQCEIKNLEALGQPLPYYDSQIPLKDPSGLKMICESSPLILPSNPNGVAGGTGFID